MLWKIYFWVIAALLVIASFGLLSNLLNLLIGDWISLICSLLMTIGLFAYVFKKQTLKTTPWRISYALSSVIFIIAMIDYFVLSESLQVFKGGLESSMTGQIIGTIVTLPTLYANYKVILSKK